MFRWMLWIFSVLAVFLFTEMWRAALDVPADYLRSELKHCSLMARFKQKQQSDVLDKIWSNKSIGSWLQIKYAYNYLQLLMHVCLKHILFMLNLYSSTNKYWFTITWPVHWKIQRPRAVRAAPPLARAVQWIKVPVAAVNERPGPRERTNDLWKVRNWNGPVVFTKIIGKW